MTAATACRSCGTEMLENARFCHSCGAALTGEAQPAEYKQVTVLFADVVHSMDIAAAVGPERLREIMTELARAKGDEVVYRQLADDYLEMAESLGFEGHIAVAKAM